MPIFPKLEIKPPKLSNHDRSHYFRTSMAVGPLVPIAVIPCNAGDDNYLNVESLVNTQALLSPLYGSYKLKIMAFFAGTSLYCPKLWRNGSMVGSDGSLDVNYPTFIFNQPFNTDSREKVALIREDQLLAYLGFPPGYIDVALTQPTGVQREYNAIPLLMYWDIWRHYFCNRQEKRFPYFSHVPTPNKNFFSYDQVAKLDDFFLSGLPAHGGPINVNSPVLGVQTAPDCILSAFSGVGSGTIGKFNQFNPMQGLAVGTYLPDRTNVILNSEFYENNVSSVTVSTVGDSFQVDQLVTAKKLWNSRNKDAMSGGTFKDWVRMHFGVTPKIMDDMPTFLGATNIDISFEDIRATTRANVDGDDQFLGDKGSSGTGYGSSRAFRCVADRPGYIMVLAQIVPRVDYYQNLERFTLNKKLSDEFRPEFNNIGLQDVLVSDINASFEGITQWATETVVQENVDPSLHAVGKQPAYIEQMSALNTVRGSFCSTENSWVLTRDFRARLADSMSLKSSGPVHNTDISAYIDPVLWNQPFANQAQYAQNFLVQFFVKNVVRSTVAKRLLPKF